MWEWKIEKNMFEQKKFSMSLGVLLKKSKSVLMGICAHRKIFFGPERFPAAQRCACLNTFLRRQTLLEKPFFFININ